MFDMPSHGSREELEGADRADEYFVLLSDVSQTTNIEALRRILAADAGALAGIVATDFDNLYDSLRNLKEYSGALVRLADVAIERVTEATNRNEEANRNHDRIEAAANGAAHHVEELTH